MYSVDHDFKWQMTCTLCMPVSVFFQDCPVSLPYETGSLDVPALKSSCGTCLRATCQGVTGFPEAFSTVSGGQHEVRSLTICCWSYTSNFDWKGAEEEKPFEHLCSLLKWSTIRGKHMSVTFGLFLAILKVFLSRPTLIANGKGSGNPCSVHSSSSKTKNLSPPNTFQESTRHVFYYLNLSCADNTKQRKPFWNTVCHFLIQHWKDFHFKTVNSIVII